MPRRSDTDADAATVVDDVDRRLIAALREDGRLSINELSTRIHVSRANAYQRLAKLQKAGIIRRFTLEVDHQLLGDSISAFIHLDIDQHAWRTIGDRLLKIPGVEYVALTTGTADLMLLVRAPDMETLRDVVLERLQSMPEVRSTQTSFVLEELRR